MGKPVIGMQLYTMRNHCTTVEDLNVTLKKLSDIGYTTTQVSGISKVEPEDIAKAHEDNGLEIACTHMGWGEFVGNLDRVIEIHKMYKCKHPAIGGLGRGEEYLSMDGIKKFADELAPVAEKLRAEGMDFSFHNHAHEFTHFEGKPWL
ncbi:MAG: sugar phosphate isomerase/epimerase family protein, partial [Planctomycetota bacterium]